MSDTIYNTDKCSDGMYRLRQRVIAPRNQAEADAIYQDLDSYMCDESIFQDGEASYTEAKKTFTFYLQKAKQVKKLGFLPTLDLDVFHPKGYVPTSWTNYRYESR
jgi:hypothetical protein